MPPRLPTEGPSNDGAYREILARIEGLGERVDAMGERVDGASSDAREGRDASLKISEHLSTLDLPRQLAGLRKDMETGDQGLRQDLVNSITHVRRELQDADGKLGERVGKLETARAEFQGATGLVAWLSRHAPWLIALTVTIAAALGLRDKIH